MRIFGDNYEECKTVYYLSLTEEDSDETENNFFFLISGENQIQRDKWNSKYTYAYLSA